MTEIFSDVIIPFAILDLLAFNVTALIWLYTDIRKHKAKAVYKKLITGV